ncbi:MAG: acetate/propionate family kinase [Micromonosporaceae bacterium]
MMDLTRILVVNAGSSSLKLRVLDDEDQVVDAADLPAPTGAADTTAVEKALASFGDVQAAGYRIVHGGTFYTSPVRVTPQVRERLKALTDLAPLHQPKSLAALDAVQAALPGVPGVACFDTAFHARIPAAAATYAIPSQWRKRWALRRYGFHGLSHDYASRRVAELLGREAGALRVVTCHLGAGASLAAVRGGRSVDTTMGFTPLDGLVMATRSGAIDPGLVLWLEEHVGTPPAELAATLEHRSGLLGLAGTGDMRAILAAAGTGDPDAVLALDVYLHRLRTQIAAMAAAMDGLDALVFTGGVGENSAEVRAKAMGGLGFLGVRVDPARNEAGTGDREIGQPDAPVRSFVVNAREDKQIAAEVRRVLGGTEQSMGSAGKL